MLKKLSNTKKKKRKESYDLLVSSVYLFAVKDGKNYVLCLNDDLFSINKDSFYKKNVNLKSKNIDFKLYNSSDFGTRILYENHIIDELRLREDYLSRPVLKKEFNYYSSLKEIENRFGNVTHKTKYSSEKNSDYLFIKKSFYLMKVDFDILESFSFRNKDFNLTLISDKCNFKDYEYDLFFESFLFDADYILEKLKSNYSDSENLIKFVEFLTLNESFNDFIYELFSNNYFQIKKHIIANRKELIFNSDCKKSFNILKYHKTKNYEYWFKLHNSWNNLLNANIPFKKVS